MIKTRYFSKLLILFMILNLVLSFAISPVSAEEPRQVTDNLENIVKNIPEDIEVNGELFENAKIKVIHEEDTTTFETIVEVTEEVSTEVKLEVQQGTDNILLHEKTVEGNTIIEDTTYSAEILVEDNNLLKVEFTDLTTGETYTLDNFGEVSASFAPAIPIGIGIVSWLLSHLISIGAAITILGTTFILFTKAKKSRKFEHFKATIYNGKLYIGNGVGYASAVNWSKKGKGHDTWSTSKSAAKKVARGVRNGLKPVGPEIDSNRKGKFYHYHPYGRSPSVHAFYGNPQ
jgi:hypothetical protein